MPAAVISPEAGVSFSHLQADGSATYSDPAGYTIIGSVNGPIEITRRDELPEEAAVDVVVRPAVGVGGKKRQDISSQHVPPISHIMF